MKQIVIEIDDEAYESFLSMLNLCPAIRVVSEVEIADTLAGRDVCMREAICILRGNNVFRHYYDYAWIMMAINDGVITMVVTHGNKTLQTKNKADFPSL